MKLVIFEPEPEFSRVLVDLLERSSFRISLVGEIPEILTCVQEKIPDLLLLELPQDLKDIRACLVELRGNPAGEGLPILLMSGKWTDSDPHIQHLLATHNCQGFLSRPFPMLDLPERIRDAAAIEVGTSPVTRKSTRKKPHRKTLKLLESIWKERKTGVLRLESSDDWALFTQGATSDENSLNLAEKAMYGGGATFAETNQSGSAPLEPLAGLLFEGHLALARTTFVLRRDSTWAAPGLHFERVLELPISKETRTLLDKSEEETTLGALLGDSDVPLLELAALENLEIIEFQPVATRQPAPEAPAPPEQAAVEDVAPPSAPPPEESPPDLPTEGSPPPKPTPGDATVVEKRLAREWEALKDADHYTVLGASPSTAPDVLQKLADRMIQRYTELVQDQTLSPPAREQAEKILRQVQNAQTLVAGRTVAVQSSSASTSPVGNLSKEDGAFKEGQAAMEAGLYERAALCFKAARNERLDSARNLSWLGWATYHNENISLDERCNEALDFLRLASSFDPHHRDGQYFLAFIEGKHGKPDQAIKRLQGLLQDDPENTIARALLSKLRREHGS